MKIQRIILVLILIIGCSENDYQKKGTSIVKEKFSITTRADGGYSGGVTKYLAGSTSAMGNNFLSQYPLVDFVYKQNVTYDSIVSYTINEETGDTLSIQIDRDIISRDTLDFYTTAKWLPFGYWNETHMLSLYIGLSSEIELQNEIILNVLRTNNINSNYDMSVFMPDSTTLAERLGIYDGMNPVRHRFTQAAGDEEIGDPLTLVAENHYQVVNDVPIYDETGLVVGTQFGIKLNPIVFFHQIIDEEVNPQTRTFQILLDIGNQKITSDFTFRYVRPEDYDKRQCWLLQFFECKDYYTQ